MTPMPTHLVGLLDVATAVFVDNRLDASVQCSCGSRIFELMYPGQTHEVEGQLIPCTAEINGSFFFRIEVRCTQCAEKHLLFDADFHGWDGFVCRDEVQASLPRPPLETWRCLSCQEPGHTARVQVQNEGQEDFLDNAPTGIDPSRWVDGFGWFSMSISCAHCSCETSEWVSYETM
jgi:hypothetical protein